jgi:hypothetical protein
MKSTHSRHTLLQVLQKCRVRATSEMLLERTAMSRSESASRSFARVAWT